MNELIPINSDLNLYYFASTKYPLSSNVVIIRGRKSTWFYDVGAHSFIPAWAKNQSQPKHIILSHFHPDHCSNLNRMKYETLYLGNNTFRYIKQGNIVEKDLYISDEDLHLHIFPIPSSHAKGSLALEVNKTYCFLGDATYSTQKNGRPVYNSGLLKEQIQLLSNIEAPYLFISHKEPFGEPKEEVLTSLQQIYERRSPGNPYIEV